MTLLEVSQRLDSILDNADISDEKTMKALEELNDLVYDAVHWEPEED